MPLKGGGGGGPCMTHHTTAFFLHLVVLDRGSSETAETLPKTTLKPLRLNTRWSIHFLFFLSPFLSFSSAALASPRGGGVRARPKRGGLSAHCKRRSSNQNPGPGRSPLVPLSHKVSMLVHLLGACGTKATTISGPWFNVPDLLFFFRCLRTVCGK